MLGFVTLFSEKRVTPTMHEIANATSWFTHKYGPLARPNPNPNPNPNATIDSQSLIVTSVDRYAECTIEPLHVVQNKAYYGVFKGQKKADILSDIMDVRQREFLGEVTYS